MLIPIIGISMEDTPFAPSLSKELCCSSKVRTPPSALPITTPTLAVSHSLGSSPESWIESPRGAPPEQFVGVETRYPAREIDRHALEIRVDGRGGFARTDRLPTLQHADPGRRHQPESGHRGIAGRGDGRGHSTLTILSPIRSNASVTVACGVRSSSPT